MRPTTISFAASAALSYSRIVALVKRARAFLAPVVPRCTEITTPSLSRSAADVTSGAFAVLTRIDIGRRTYGSEKLTRFARSSVYERPEQDHVQVAGAQLQEERVERQILNLDFAAELLAEAPHEVDVEALELAGRRLGLEGVVLGLEAHAQRRKRRGLGPVRVPCAFVPLRRRPEPGTGRARAKRVTSRRMGGVYEPRFSRSRRESHVA